MADPTLLLAIDTSTRFAGVALSCEGQLLAEYTWQAGTNHTRQLIPVIKAVLQENQARLEDVGVIAVASGPGSFNGLRVGMATAKAFARTLGVPLVAVGTLEVEAYPHAAFPGAICPVHDAGRGDLAWALYRGDADERVMPSPSAPLRINSAKHLAAERERWHCLREPAITKPQELIEAIQKPTLLCGEPPEWAMGELKNHAVTVSPAASVRRAASLAELGWHRHQAGDHADVATLSPLYLRRPPGENP